MRKLVLLVILTLWVPLGWAKLGTEPLPVEQAFPLTIHLDSRHRIVAEWDIAPGYYLYRDKIHFSFVSPNQVGDIMLPQGVRKQDAIHGTFQAYFGKIKIYIPLLSLSGEIVNLQVKSQGCSTRGFCYPPVTKQFQVTVSNVSDVSKSSQDYAAEILAGHQLIMVLLVFLGLGLLLAFTPCVLPMVPILSGIIVGYHRKETLTTLRAFLLSLAYVIGMAVTYMVLGVIVALAGSRIQSMMQNPWVIILFGSFFILLACSLFGWYELHVPKRWQIQIMKWDEHFKRGTYPGVFLMGCFSSLIVSPCVSAPLVGVLAYIAQTGDVVLGASALFALSIGMGIPLLLVGVSAGKLLPKSGLWMTSIQKIFGIMMLGVAIWFFSRIIPETVTVLLWAALLMLSAVMLNVFCSVSGVGHRLLKIVGIVLFIYSIVLVESVVFLQNTEPLHPLEKLYSWKHTLSQPSFTVLKTVDQANQALALAKYKKKPAIIDFYADWCANCKNIETRILRNAEVEDILKNFILLRVDVTEDSDEERQLLKRFNVVAPPTFLFFDASGKELASQRLVGEFDKKQFIQHLEKSE